MGVGPPSAEIHTEQHTPYHQVSPARLGRAGPGQAGPIPFPLSQAGPAPPAVPPTFPKQSSPQLSPLLRPARPRLPSPWPGGRESGIPLWGVWVYVV